MTGSTHPTSPSLAAVIFDLGGTLIYPSTTDGDNAAHLTAWLRSLGHPAELGAAVREARRWMWEMTSTTGRQHTMQEAVRRAAAQLNLGITDGGFVEAAERVFFEPEMEGYRAFPGAVEMLERLSKAGLRLGCISNASSHWLIEQIVERMGFGPYLDPVVSSAGFGRAKPDPAIFHSVLDRWGVEPARAAMVGDTLEADMGGGQGVGMRTLYVTMTPNPDNINHRHIRPDAEAASLEEAARILLAWQGA